MTSLETHDDATSSSLSDLLLEPPAASPAADHETPAPRTTGDTARRVAAFVVLAAVLLLVLAAVGFHLTGGRWFVVRTPSMGTVAPVGTLVLTEPAKVADLHVGDVIAFHPTDTPQLTYTHRIVAVHGATVTTRGDINGSDDPWKTGDAQVVGKATVVLPGVGYLVRALPLIGLGGLVLMALTHWWLRPRWRGPVRMVGFTVLYLVTALVIRPFVGIVQLATATNSEGASIEVASTGLLPVRVDTLPGHGTASPPVDLSYGQNATVHLIDPPADGKFALTAHLHLSFLQWLLLAAIWSLPLLWVLLVGFRRVDDDRPARHQAAAA